MKNLLILVIIIFISLSTIAFAQSFRDKVIISPDISFLWNFQRGFEELYRFVKFTQSMKIVYSLDLADRRVGEMELLIDKNRTDYVIFAESEYEREINNIEFELNSTGEFDIIEILESVKSVNKTDVIHRLQVQIKVLGDIITKVPGSSKDLVLNAAKKSSKLIGVLSKTL